MKLIESLKQMKSKYAMSEYYDKWYTLKINSLPVIYREGSICRIKAEKCLRETEGNGVYFSGRAGCGKTSVATQMLRIIWGQKIDGKFIEYQDWVTKLEDNRYSGNTWEQIEELQKFEGLLVLDDMGFEEPTKFIKKVTYLIINYRESNNLPLVITSNLFIEELGEFYDPRLVSRLQGYCRDIEPSQKDYRPDKQKCDREES